MTNKDCFSVQLVDSVKEEIKCCSKYVSREDLAERFGTSRETLCRKINDPYKMSIADLSLIADSLGKSLRFYFE